MVASSCLFVITKTEMHSTFGEREGVVVQLRDDAHDQRVGGPHRELEYL